MKHRLPLIISVSILSSSLAFADYESEFQTKADIIINWVADVYATPGGFNPYDDQVDPEKYSGPKMAARFTKYGVADAGGTPLGTNPPNAVNANVWLEQGVIESAGNPYLFHFRFLGTAGILALFPDAPGATGTFATPVINGVSVPKSYGDCYIESVLKGNNNYNAFTGEGTENHINMSRPSGWIYAKLAQGSPYYQARRADDPASYPDPVVLEAAMKEYLMAWAKQLYAVGSSEYDSSVYLVFNVAPWINLFEATKPAYLEDSDLHVCAKAVLDWYAAAAALKYRYGIINGASIRGEGVMDRYDRDDESDFLNWLWFGEPLDVPIELANTTVRVEHQPIQTVYAAISSYRPPAAAVALARKTGMEGTLTRHGRSNYLMSKASESLEQYYIGPGYTLGSAQFPFGGWASSVYRINQWKLVADLGSYAPAVLAGNNGLRAAKYSFRNPWVQVVQDRNVLIQMNLISSGAQTQYADAMALIQNTWVPAWTADFTARWPSPDWGGFQGLNGTPINKQDDGNVPNARTSYIWFEPALTDNALSGTVRFGQMGETYFAIRSVDGDTPAYNPSGRSFSDFSDYDMLGGLVIEAGSTSDPEYNTFSEFQTYYLATTNLELSGLVVTYTAMDGRVITATYEESGGYTEPEYDWAFGVTEPVSKMFLASYDTGTTPPESWTLPPFPTVAGSGRVASWSVDPDGEGVMPAESFDSSTVWPLFDGPNLKAIDGVLHVWDGSQIYSVDFSGTNPVFSAGSLPVPESAISIAGGKAFIEWATVNGLTYQLYKAGDLAGPWNPASDAIVGTGGLQQLDGGSVPISGEKFFWRVHVNFE